MRNNININESKVYVKCANFYINGKNIYVTCINTVATRTNINVEGATAYVY